MNRVRKGVTQIKMADSPPFTIRFKPRGTEEGAAAPRGAAPEPDPRASELPVRHDRVAIYQEALELASRIYTVIELAENERYFLRDQLDRKSAIIPQLIAQGLATGDMVARRALYQRAREATTDCAAILDMVGERGTVEREAIAPARALALSVLERLLPLTVAPSRNW